MLTFDQNNKKMNLKKIFVFMSALLLQAIAVSAFAQGLPDVLRVCYHIDPGYEGLLERMFFPQSDNKDDDIYNRRNIWGFIRNNGYPSCIYCINTKSGYELVGQWSEEDIWKAAFYQVYDTIQTNASVSWKRNDVRWEDVELDIDITEKRLSITNDQALTIAKLFQVAISTSTTLFRPGQSYSVYVDEDGNKRAYLMIGLDGSSTMFFYKGLAAESWSPQEGKLKRLNDIANEINNAVASKDIRIIRNILPEVHALTDEFTALLPDWAKEYLELTYSNWQ